jgi:hypothetical protein
MGAGRKGKRSGFLHHGAAEHGIEAARLHLRLEDWERWVSSPPRKALQDKIDALLGRKTTYDIYHYPEKRYFKAEPSDYLERTPTKSKK